MGFLDFFKKSKTSEKEDEQAQQKPFFIELNDLKDWIQQEFGTRELDAVRDMVKLSNEIISEFKDMVNALKILEDSSFTGLGRNDKIINMIKNSFVTKAKRDLSEIPTLKEKTYSGFQEFLTASMEKASQAINSTHKQGQILSAYFNKEGKEFFESFRKLENSIKSMKNKLDSDYSFLKSMNIVDEKRNTLIKANEELNFLKEKLDENTLQIKNLEKDIQLETNKLNNLKLGPEWKKLGDERKKLNDLKKEKTNIENELIGQLGTITRVLKKFEHDTADKNVMRFLKSPLKTVTSLNNEVIVLLFKKINETASMGTIKFNEREKKHLRTFIGNLHNLLEKKTQLLELKKKINEVRDSLFSSPVVREQRHVQTKIDQLKKELENLKEERKDINLELRRLKELRDSCIKSIEQEIKSQGYNVKLKI